jgi:hypothetical protein
MDGYIRGMEEALRLALEATSGDFYRWEEEIGPPLEARGYDEFSLPEAFLQAMRTEEKLAYVARLLRSLALQYGVSAYQPQSPRRPPPAERSGCVGRRRNRVETSRQPARAGRS